MTRVAKTLLVAATAALIVTASIAQASAAAPPLATASACTKATNIEAIVDDSGSMAITDPNRLRVQAMDLLINALDPPTQLGAVEFGSALFETPGADTLFPPQPVGPNAAAMKSALDGKVNADNGATDYNAGFAQSDADNPSADARIFLTDGGHDIGAYNEAHQAHSVPTYVIGFGSGISSDEDQQRLKKIASDTGGHYYPLKEASQLQPVMDSIEAVLTCQTPPRTFIDLLTKGASKTHSVAIGASTKAIQIALTWVSPLDKFKISGLRLIGPKGVIAVAPRRKPSKLKVTRASSTTYTVLKISGLRKGRLQFAVKAAKVGSGAPKATLTTQVSQTSHR